MFSANNIGTTAVGAGAETRIGLVATLISGL
jgi:hypothetical protein